MDKSVALPSSTPRALAKTPGDSNRSAKVSFRLSSIRTPTPIAASACVAVAGNLHEAESDRLADRRADGIAMDALFLELAASND